MVKAFKDKDIPVSHMIVAYKMKFQPCQHHLMEFPWQCDNHYTNIRASLPSFTGTFFGSNWVTLHAFGRKATQLKPNKLNSLDLNNPLDPDDSSDFYLPVASPYFLFSYQWKLAAFFLTSFLPAVNAWNGKPLPLGFRWKQYACLNTNSSS
jgi:hypothetical protein